jgi:biotin carboxylase
MHYHIVIQQAGAYKVDWNKFSGLKSQFLLIADEISVQKITAAKQNSIFAQVILCNDFSFENLVKLLETVIHKSVGNTFSLATVYETDLLNVARLREHFHLEGDKLSTILPFRNKLRMKETLAKLPGSFPKYLAFDNQAYKADPLQYCATCIEQLGLPIFAKPIAEAGSKGTTKIENEVDLHAWCQAHAQSNDYELDEFIDGTLYHCDSICINGKIVYCQIGEDIFPESECLSGKPMGTIVLSESSPLFSEIKAFNEKILRQYPILPNGCTHLELFKTRDNRLLFLEVAARPPGGLIPEMYARYTGLDFREIHYKLQFDIPIDLTPKKGQYAAWVYFIRQPGTISKLNAPSHFKSEYQLNWKHQVGDTLLPAEDDADCIGTLFFSHENHDVVRADFDSLKQFLPVEMSLTPPAPKTLLLSTLVATASSPTLESEKAEDAVKVKQAAQFY